jgi:hypothetical protein
MWIISDSDASHEEQFLRSLRKKGTVPAVAMSSASALCKWAIALFSAMQRRWMGQSRNQAHLNHFPNNSNLSRHVADLLNCIWQGWFP